MSISDQFEFIIPTSAAIEKDPKTGHEFIYAKITNPFIREMKSAEDIYIDEWKLAKDEEGKSIRFNPEDTNDLKEMKISKKINDEIHNCWKLLNPSGESPL